MKGVEGCNLSLPPRGWLGPGTGAELLQFMDCLDTTQTLGFEFWVVRSGARSWTL